ncbi:MAG: chlorite dismutase family protein [Gemmatimonadota bacterium]
MSPSPLAPLALDGWYLLHQFFQGTPRHAAALVSRFQEWDDLDHGGWSAVYRIVGGEADYMVMHFRPSLEALAEVEEELLRRAPDWQLVSDYLSVVELGLYALTAALVEQTAAEGIQPGSEEWQVKVKELLDAEGEKRHVQARLHPRQPEDMPYVCFYPMDKRRKPGQNWYTLPLDQRASLMMEHGKTGRGYAGRISQIISGSVGFDDWEWGVTLFASDPLDFKRLVTEMRYDEVSALYAEFGNFWVGFRLPSHELAEKWAKGEGHQDG